MKCRIVKKYNPYCGTWYEIQVKEFGRWKTLPLVYRYLEYAQDFAKSFDKFSLSDIRESTVVKVCK